MGHFDLICTPCMINSGRELYSSGVFILFMIELFNNDILRVSFTTERELYYQQ
jgi:hypothetical protein